MGYSGNTKNFMSILYNASKNDREAYRIIYDDMVEKDLMATSGESTEEKIKDAVGGRYMDDLYYAYVHGTGDYEKIYADIVELDLLSTPTKTTEQRIASLMESRIKKAMGVSSVEELEQRYLGPAQEQTYTSLQHQASESGLWGKASDEQREAWEKDLYSLVVGGDSAGAAMQEKIDGGAAYGIDEAEYVLYRLALHIADKPNDSGNLGSYTNDEVEAAIDMLTGLSREARGYLWEAQGKSEKNNPYK